MESEVGVRFCPQSALKSSSGKETVFFRLIEGLQAVKKTAMPFTPLPPPKPVSIIREITRLKKNPDIERVIAVIASGMRVPGITMKIPAEGCRFRKLYRGEN